MKIEKANFTINNIVRPGVRVCVDSLIIEAIELDMADQWDFMELAGSQIDNHSWVNVALLAASVVTINGVPQPSGSRTRETIRAILRKIGPSGLDALQVAFGEEPGADRETEIPEEAIAAGN